MKHATPTLLILTVMAIPHALTAPCGAESPPAAIKAIPFFHLQDLYTATRIPNIIVAADGSVLAFAKSGRLLRRSEDAGQTWSPPAEVGPDAAGSAILDVTTGDVMVVRSKGGYLWRSGDHGKTWKRQTITVRPNAIGHGSPGGVGAQTACSESGITLRYGKHKGRLLMPARIQPPKGSNAQRL